MKIFSSFFCVASCAIFVTACGGGSGSSAPVATPPPPPPTTPPPPTVTDENPGGIWFGAFTSTVLNDVDQIIGIASETGEIRFLSLDDGAQYFGQISITGNSFTGALSAVSPAGATFPNGAASGNVDVDGSIDSRASITGSFIGVGDQGSFSLSYDSLYERDSSLANVTAHWSAPVASFKALLAGQGDSAIGFAVADTGNFAGADTGGCDYSGSIALRDSNFNIYDVILSISSCGLLNGQYSGPGVLSDDAQTSDTLTIAVSNDDYAVSGNLNRSVAQSPAGIWAGVLQSPLLGNIDIIGEISEEKELHIYSQSGTQFAGTSQVFGNVLRISATAFSPSDTVFADGSVSGPIDARGIVETRVRSFGTFAGIGESGSFDITYDSIYEKTSALTKVAGDWYTSIPGGTLDVSIAANGDFAGSDSACDYSGAISLIDANLNMYRVSGQLLTCAGLSGDYTGFGFLTDRNTVDDALTVSVSNAITSHTAFFYKRP